MATKDQASEFDTITSLADDDKLFALDVSATALNDESGPGGTVVGITYANFKLAIGGVGIFRPESYGAAADGTTDDTTAIQAAVTAASAAGGGIVQFDAATYLTQDITGADKVHFRGLGRGATVLKLKDATNEAILNISSADQFMITDMSLDGNSANQTSGDCHGVRLISCTEVVVRNVEAYDCDDDGFYVSACTDVLHEFCYSHDNGRNGFSCGENTGLNTNITYRECHSENHNTLTSDIGFSVEPGKNVKLINCESAADSYGITVVDSASMITGADTLITGCRITSPGVYGIYAGGIYGGTGLQITNNVIIGGSTTTSCIEMLNPSSGGGEEVTITGNKITSTAPTTKNTHGIVGASSATGYLSITANTIHDLGGHGIHLDECEGATVTGNVIYNCSRQAAGTYDGIRLGSTANDVVITSNRIFDDQGTKTQEYAVKGTSGTDYITVTGNDLRTNRTGTTTTLGSNSTVSGNTGATGWITWSPSFTGITVGNGTLVARYQLEGKTCRLHVHLTLGSTSSVSGGARFAAPFTARTGIFSGGFQGVLSDTGTATWKAFPFYSGGDFYVGAETASGTYVGYAGISSTVPFTWTTSDILEVYGEYEIA